MQISKSIYKQSWKCVHLFIGYLPIRGIPNNAMICIVETGMSEFYPIERSCHCKVLRIKEFWNHIRMQLIQIIIIIINTNNFQQEPFVNMSYALLLCQYCKSAVHIPWVCKAFFYGSLCMSNLHNFATYQAAHVDHQPHTEAHLMSPIFCYL